MLPKPHIFYGAVFSFFLWIIFPNLNWYVLVIFLASFLIDVDHYISYILIKKDFSLKKAYKYFRILHEKMKNLIKKGKKAKAPLVVLHTIEFFIILLFLSFFSNLVLFVFIGFLFHSILDLIDIYMEFGTLYPRQFSVIFFLIDRNRKDILKVY